MSYQAPIRGKFVKRPEKVTRQGFAGSVESLLRTVEDLKRVEKAVVEKIDGRMTELELLLQEIHSTARAYKQEITEMREEAIGLIASIKKGDPGQNADETYIVNSVLSQIPKESLDLEMLISKVLERVPKGADEKALIKRVIRSLPENKASLKIIQEKFETDPMSVIDKIMQLPEGKFKLKLKHIDGLEQTIQAFQNQLRRGYLHGGGGSNLSYETPTGTVNGSNVTFTLSKTPQSGTLMLFVNGQLLAVTSDYSLSGSTITLVNAPLTGSSLRAQYQT